MLSNTLDLFYILKLNTDFIIKNNLNIKLSYEEANNKNYIVALGDSQLFSFLREIKNEKENVKKIHELKNLIKIIERQPNSKQNSQQLHILQKELKYLTFIPDILSIKTNTTKKDYKYICKNKVKITFTLYDKTYEITYVRLCAGAGQLRRNSSIFVNEEYYQSLETRMMCGLTKSRIGKINLAKFSAYFALYTSATRKVTTPNICVIPDFEYTLKNQLVDWIYDTDNGEKNIEERTIDFNINAFDGAGIISPKMAKIWTNDLSLNYLPSSFIIRSAWIKGLVSVFDFHEFAEKIANKKYIIDVWGDKWDINNIDMILTASQFKMYKKYNSWNEYIYYHKIYHHIFSVARVNKKENNKYTELNYQYIQTNNFTNESICSIASYSKNIIQKVLDKDYMYTMLYLNPNTEINNFDDMSINDMFGIALSYCPLIMNDKYFQDKIFRDMKNKIDKMKIGKILVSGCYEFTIPDLYALAEHAFGLPVKGLLPENSLWNYRWVNEGAEKVTSMRSPLVAPSENRLLNVYHNDKCNYWFKYIYSGNIYNIWDMTLIAESDADYDGDLTMTSNNNDLINAVGYNKKVITYEKKKSQEHKLNMNNFASMDTKSFNSKIGVITNIASNMISLSSIYDKDSEERKELEKRIKLLRFFQGSAIDSTKGDIFVPPPKYWSKKLKYIQSNKSLSEEELQKIKDKNKIISFNNKICVNKKAYFFIYIYPKLKEEYDAHIKNYKILCKQLFGISLNQLFEKQNRTEEENKFIKKYYYYMPVVKNNCIMNQLAYYIEDMELNFKYRKNINNFDYTLFLSPYFIPQKSKITKVRTIISQCLLKQSKQLYSLFDDTILLDKDSIEETENYIFQNTLLEMKEQLYNISSNYQDISNYIIYCFYNYFNNKSKSFMWSIAGKHIIQTLQSKANVFYALEESNNKNNIEYLGKYYNLIEKEVNHDSIR